MYLAAAVDNNSTDILAVANSPFLWACAIGVFPVIIIHSVIYMKAAQIAAPHIGMTHQEIKTSCRAGAISALGPSLAVVMVAVALLTVFGTPAVLVRIGLIGSVSYETAAAAIAANSAGAELGGPTYTQAVFGLALAAMTLGGAMWMIATLILTPYSSEVIQRCVRSTRPSCWWFPVRQWLELLWCWDSVSCPDPGSMLLPSDPLR